VDLEARTPYPTAGRKYLVLSFDCLQYYVKPWILKRYYGQLDPVFFVVGLNYYPFYGTYPYLAGNGRVVVSSKDGFGWVDVITNGGGSYSHNLSIYRGRVQSVRMGLTTVYFDITSRMWEKYSFVPMPTFSSSNRSILCNIAARQGLVHASTISPFTPQILATIF